MNFDELEKLALDLNLGDPEISNVESSGINNVYLTRVPEVRILHPSWMDGGATATFKWTDTNQDRDQVDPLFEDHIIHELNGFIVHAEIQPFLSLKKDDDEDAGKPKIICSCVGYKHQGKLVSKLPSDGLKVMYAWDNATESYSTNVPAPIVDSLMLVGSRGKTCSECIRSGDSVIETGGKVSSCAPYGRMFFYVTEIIRNKKVKGPDNTVEVVKSSTTIREILGKSGLILAINMPGKVAIKGLYNRDPEKSINGYAGYVTSLAKKYGASRRADYRFTGTSISIAPSPPGRKSTKNFLHLTQQETFDISLLKDALEEWKNLLEINNIDIEGKDLDPSLFGLDETLNPVYHASSSSATSPTSFKIEDEELDSPF